jgi:hypothetical protein
MLFVLQHISVLFWRLHTVLKTFFGGVLSVAITLALLGAFFYQALSLPQVYYSTSATRANHGRPVCAKIETPEGELPCSQLVSLTTYNINWSR